MNRGLILFFVVAFVLGLVPMATAMTMQTFTSSCVLDNLPVQSTATFIIDPDADTIEIKVYNNIANPKSVIQALSDLGFVLNTGQTSGTLTSSSGLARTIAGDGTLTDGSTVATGWGLQTGINYGAPGSGLKLNALGFIGPAHLIIGPPDGSNIYSNANGSIAGNEAHNPFLFGDSTNPVDFLLSVPGIDSSTRVNFVQFSYGTTAGNNCNTTPVPRTILLLGTGLLGLGLLGRRRKSGA